MVIIGDIVHGVVVKNIPHAESYLIWIYGKELFATLPKIHALREYKLQEQIFAAIMDIKGARITLSQRIPQFTKAMLYTYLKEFFTKNKLELSRAIALLYPGNFNFIKVLIKSLNTSEEELNFKQINELLKPELTKLPEIYKNSKIYLIPFRGNLTELVKEALQPAPKEKILGVQEFGVREYTVLVPKELVGAYLGKKGINLTTASKLIKCNITIEGV